MKKLVFAAILAGHIVPALADVCVALDYQEMKDMKAEDLSKEYCKAKVNADTFALTSQFYSLLGTTQIQPREQKAAAKSADTAQSAAIGAEQCKSQMDRIGRVLVQKGIEEANLPNLCPSAKKN